MGLGTSASQEPIHGEEIVPHTESAIELLWLACGAGTSLFLHVLTFDSWKPPIATHTYEYSAMRVAWVFGLSEY